MSAARLRKGTPPRNGGVKRPDDDAASDAGSVAGSIVWTGNQSKTLVENAVPTKPLPKTLSFKTPPKVPSPDDDSGARPSRPPTRPRRAPTGRRPKADDPAAAGYRWEDHVVASKAAPVFAGPGGGGGAIVNKKSRFQVFQQKAAVVALASIRQKKKEKSDPLAFGLPKQNANVDPEKFGKAQQRPVGQAPGVHFRPSISGELDAERQPAPTVKFKPKVPDEGPDAAGAGDAGPLDLFSRYVAHPAARLGGPPTQRRRGQGNNAGPQPLKSRIGTAAVTDDLELTSAYGTEEKKAAPAAPAAAAATGPIDIFSRRNSAPEIEVVDGQLSARTDASATTNRTAATTRTVGHRKKKKVHRSRSMPRDVTAKWRAAWTKIKKIGPTKALRKREEEEENASNRQKQTLFVAKRTAYEFILKEMRPSPGQEKKKRSQQELWIAYKVFCRENGIPRKGQVDVLTIAGLMRNVRSALDVMAHIQMDDVESQEALLSAGDNRKVQASPLTHRKGTSKAGSRSSSSRNLMEDSSKHSSKEDIQEPPLPDLVEDAVEDTVETGGGFRAPPPSMRVPAAASDSPVEDVDDDAVVSDEDQSDDKNGSSFPSAPPPTMRPAKGESPQKGTEPSPRGQHERKLSFQKNMEEKEAARQKLHGSDLLDLVHKGLRNVRPGARSRVPKIILSSEGGANLLMIKGILRVEDNSVELDAGAKSREFPPERTSQFGLPLAEVDSVQLSSYKAPIARLLVDIKQQMIKRGALLKEGIFRVPPKESELLAAQHEIDGGTFTGAGVHVLATLLKRWLSSLPDPLLGSLDDEDFVLPKEAGREKDAAVHNTVEKLPEPYQSTFLWLIDLLADITHFSSVNRMSAHNLAVVFSPNLRPPPDLQQMKASDARAIMHAAMRVSSFVEAAIEWRGTILSKAVE